MSLRAFWDSIYGLCQVSVHREGVNPSSMEGVLELKDHISVNLREKIKQLGISITEPLIMVLWAM